MAILLALSLLWPLLLALTAVSGRYPGIVRWWWSAPLPMGVVALFPAAELQLPGLLVGIAFRMDTLARSFSLLAALIWGTAGWQLRHHSTDRQFQFFFGLTLTGNLGVLSAADGLTFYACFSLMALAAYGILRPFAGARRGARWYLGLALVGELALLWAILLLGQGGSDFQTIAQSLADHPQQALVVGLIYLAFAIKVGNFPLHSWLPLAYGSGHPLATLVFGGVITNLGILGWCRFLAPGQWASDLWSQWFIGIGLLTAIYCALMGACQRRPRTILGYSSASQMGLATALVGVALARMDQWFWLQSLLILFSLHHGILKAALMLAVRSQHASRVTWLLLCVSALALAGLPPTSGWLVKQLMKEATAFAPTLWTPWLASLFTLSSVTTGIMMIRLLERSRMSPGRDDDGPWILLALLSLLVWPLGFNWLPTASLSALSMKSFIQALEAPAIAALLMGGVWLLGLRIRLGEADLAMPLSRIRWPRWRSGVLPVLYIGYAPLWRWMALGERRLRRTQIAGLLLLSLLGVLAILSSR